MTLEQLRIFAAVAEREHMTRAAGALHLTQPAISGAIAALEQAHAVKLFHRIGRGIALTDAGRSFLPVARDLLVRAEAARQILSESDGPGAGMLRIVASQTIAAYWLPPLLVRFRAAFPRVSVAVSIANTEEAAAQVAEGGCELGLVEGQVEASVLERWPVARDAMVLVGRNPPPRAISPDWLRQVPWVLRESGSGTRSVLLELLAGKGIALGELTVAMTLPSNEAVRTAAEYGSGVALLSSLVVASALETGALHAYPFENVTRPFFALRHRERFHSKAVAALLAMI